MQNHVASTMEVLDAVRALPKVELHLHILGSIRPERLLEILSKDGIKTPYRTVEDITKRLQYRDFSSFIETYMDIVDYLGSEKHFEQLTYDMLESCHRCNTRYVEASFSPRDHMIVGLDFHKVLDAILKGRDRAQGAFGLQCDIQVDLVRASTIPEAMEILDLIETRKEDILSIDIGGNEPKFPPEPFAPVYERARNMGLRTVAHAGEWVGPHSIWGAIKHLKVERIGHGTSAGRDPELVEYLRANRIPLEICPISNVRTGSVPSLREHPIREYFDKGLLITVNSDDPSLFHTDLNNEYLELHRELGFTLEELYHISLNGIEASFLNGQRKHQMTEAFQREYAEILSE